MSFTSAIEILKINAFPREIGDYLERFELWWLTKGKVKDDLISAHFLTAIGREAYSLLKNLTFPKAPSTLQYDDLKKILLAHIMPKSFEIAKQAKFNILQRQNQQTVRDFVVQI